MPGKFRFESPWGWCMMDLPFAFVFCPLPIPQINILIKMMIPGAIRPVIDMILQKFAQGQDAMLQVLECLLPPTDGTGPRGGPPSFLETCASKPEGKLVPALKEQLFAALVNPMTEDVGAFLTGQLHSAAHDPLLQTVTQSLQSDLEQRMSDILRDNIGRSVGVALNDALVESVANAVYARLLPTILLSAVENITPALSESIALGVVRSTWAASNPDAESVCRACTATGWHCDACRAKGAARTAALQRATGIVQWLAPIYAQQVRNVTIQAWHKARLVTKEKESERKFSLEELFRE